MSCLMLRTWPGDARTVPTVRRLRHARRLAPRRPVLVTQHLRIRGVPCVARGQARASFMFQLLLVAIVGCDGSSRHLRARS